MAIFLMSATCSVKPKRNADIGNLIVTEYVVIDDVKGNKITGSKVCVEEPGYKYMYQLNNGLWVASNDQWKIGDRLQLISVPDTVNESTTERTTR